MRTRRVFSSVLTTAALAVTLVAAPAAAAPGPYLGAVDEPDLIHRSAGLGAPRQAAAGTDVQLRVVVTSDEGVPCTETTPVEVRAASVGRPSLTRIGSRVTRVDAKPGLCLVDVVVRQGPSTRILQVTLPQTGNLAEARTGEVVVQTTRVVTVSATRTASAYRLTGAIKPGAVVHLQRQAPDGRWATLRSTAGVTGAATFAVPRTDVARSYRLYVKQDARGTGAASRTIVVRATA